jgi:hypothetical protein
VHRLKHFFYIFLFFIASVHAEESISSSSTISATPAAPATPAPPISTTPIPKEPPFVVGQLVGQLGNQMFVIAATVSLALDHGAVPIFPDLKTRPYDNTQLNYQKIFYHLKTELPPNTRIQALYHEPFYHYSPIPYAPNMCISGYFQSEKYFKHHKKEILELFAAHPEIDTYLKKKYADILKHPNSVGVHLRYYLHEDPQETIYPQCRAKYYKEAMQLFPQDSLFVIFSNNMVFCKKEFENIPGNLYFVEGEPYCNDLYLMSMCHHNIISNSTFSWWAAYLNPNPNKKVVAPDPWYTDWFFTQRGVDSKDVIPEDWHVLKKVKE